MEPAEFRDERLERHEAWHLLWIWVGIIGFVSFAIAWLAPHTFPTDPAIVPQQLLTRVPQNLIDTGLLLTAIWLLDIITPGALLREANASPLSAGIFTGAVAIAIAIIMASY